MKPLTTRFVGAAALLFAALAAASAAQARAREVYLTFGAPPAPPVYVQPAPVYVQPAPVYVQPRPVFVVPGGYEQQRHRPAWSDRGWERRGYGDDDGDGIANRYDRDGARGQHRYARWYGPWGDLDRDGVANRDDRDRDGDGVRNRHDRFPDDRYRY